MSAHGGGGGKDASVCLPVVAVVVLEFITLSLPIVSAGKVVLFTAATSAAATAADDDALWVVAAGILDSEAPMFDVRLCVYKNREEKREGPLSTRI
jgi:hypothetical protein